MTALALGVFIALLRLDWREVASHFSRPGAILAATIWLLGLNPMLAWVLLSRFALPPDLAVASY